MKIRFPKIEYSAHIYPKPRGNWRPKVEIYLHMKIQKGQCIWRPYLTGIGFLAQKNFEECRDSLEEYITINGIKVYKSKSNNGISVSKCGKITEDGVEMDCFGTLMLIIPCSSVFWGSPKRGEGPKYEALRFKWNMYLEEGMEITHKATFYLPWRPGIKPDYSDYSKAFSIIPKLLYEMLQDGLDSGVSQEYKIGFMGSLGAVGKREEKKEGNEEVIFV